MQPESESRLKNAFNRSVNNIKGFIICSAKKPAINIRFDDLVSEFNKIEL